MLRRIRRGRGWPVVDTGNDETDNQHADAATRRHAGFPEESPDFSELDLFDVAEHLLGQHEAPESAPHITEDRIPAADNGDDAELIDTPIHHGHTHASRSEPFTANFRSDTHSASDAPGFAKQGRRCIPFFARPDTFLCEDFALAGRCRRHKG